MIKVNLLRGQGVKINKVESDADAFKEIDDKEIQKQGAIKFLLFIIGPLALYVFQMQNLDSLNASLKVLRTQNEELVAISSRGKQAVEETARIKEEQSRLQAQINIIENLRKGRTREIRLLDTLQKQMPTKMWLTELNYDHRAGSLTLKGVAKTDGDLNILMEALQSSALLKQVQLVNSMEENLKNETVKKFEIKCGLEGGA